MIGMLGLMKLQRRGLKGSGRCRDSLNPDVAVQQPIAFERVVDLFAGGLGPGIRRDMAKILTHSMNTLPILLPPYEQALLRGEGLALPGGDVKDILSATIRRQSIAGHRDR